MNPPTWLVVKDLPRPGGWDFGGFPYGLEPLTLPAHDAYDTGDAGAWEATLPDGFEDACVRLLAADPHSGPAECLDTFDQLTELCWFRWITGHQVSFIIWQLMARAIGRAAAGDGHRADVLDELAHYVRACGGMLLYTGSCPRDVYETAIRPSMYLQHRGFSGSWAPDFLPVRDLFRGRRLPWIDPEEGAGLHQAVRDFQHIHNGVATKLVPNDRSLLQRSGVDTQSEDRRLLSIIYDNYFLTLRAAVPFADVVTQLLRRLNAIALDVSVNGLHPGAAGDGTETPGTLPADDVLDLERDLVSVNFGVAKLAAGSTGRGVGEQHGFTQRRGQKRHTSAARR